MQFDFSSLQADSSRHTALPPRFHRQSFPTREPTLPTHAATRAFDATPSTLALSIETVEIAVLSLSADGVVLHATRSASRLLEAEDGLALQGRQLKASCYGEHQRLAAMLREALPLPALSPTKWQDAPLPSPRANEGAMLITRRAGKRPLQVIVMPVLRCERLAGSDCAVLVYLCDPEAVPASRSSALRRLYGLSPTECRLADHLAAGTELQAAAAHLRLTVQTARSHLKAIFRKTGTNRQATLVRLILGLPGSIL
jgi:DNA-binding CsgD family transcriptional regulator